MMLASPFEITSHVSSLPRVEVELRCTSRGDSESSAGATTAARLGRTGLSSALARTRLPTPRLNESFASGESVIPTIVSYLPASTNIHGGGESSPTSAVRYLCNQAPTLPLARRPYFFERLTSCWRRNAINAAVLLSILVVVNTHFHRISCSESSVIITD